MNDWHESQRGYFAGALLEAMRDDPNIYILTGDLGFGMWDKVRAEFPHRFINCGASEQAMVGIAVGLALKGKKPFVYTITSFLLRAAETISLYLGGEGVAVRLVGSGRNDDYKHDGASHNAVEAQNFLRDVYQLDCYYPDSKEEVADLVAMMVKDDVPAFISLRR